jgi:DNA polymerase-3 subunit gamma/tau
VGYTALYRKWRPKTFKDIIGQSHITTTLENQILNGSVAHAYLFSGSRGTGKTSTAKVFARAINCIDRETADPCNKCEVCINISKDTVMDILEIDAASNNGVNEIRELRENVKYAPAVGRYKVYIIDEVHMLSTGAFNALLKTLEEPPDHVVFILATTEPYKLPATITSRCQRYDFKRISTTDIASRLADVIASLDLTAQPKAIEAIARAADGSLRDALSLLDRTLSYGMEQLTVARVNELLGLVSNEGLIRMVDGLVDLDIPRCLDIIHKLYNDGGDIGFFIKQLIGYYRNLLIMKACTHPDRLLDIDEVTMDNLAVQAGRIGQNTIVRTVHILSETESRCKWSSQPKVLLEMAVVDICKPQMDSSLEGLIERVSMLEKRLEGKVLAQEADRTYPPDPSGKCAQGADQGAESSRMPAEETPADGVKAGPPNPEKEAGIQEKGSQPSSVEEAGKSSLMEEGDQPISMDKAGQPSFEDKAGQPGTDEILAIRKHWPQILDKAKKQKEMLISTFMHLGKPVAVKNRDVYIEFPKDAQMHMDMLNTEERRAIIGDIIYNVCGRQYGVKFVVRQKNDDKGLENMDRLVDTVIKKVGIDKVDIIE